MAPGEELSGCLVPSCHRLAGSVTLCLSGSKRGSIHFRNAYLVNTVRGTQAFVPGFIN